MGAEQGVWWLKVRNRKPKEGEEKEREGCREITCTRNWEA